MKKNSFEIIKNILIILLIIIVIVLTIVLFSSKINIVQDSKQKQFLSDILKMQNKISYYIGKTNSDTFGVYDDTQIILGTEDKSNEKTKDVNNTTNNITEIVDSTQKIEKNNKVYYKVIDDNIKQVLNETMPEYEGITWYIEDGKLLKVKFDTKPEWWTDSFNSLLVGQD